MDPVLLARLQFAVTIGFHFLFPPLSIGLAWLLVMAEWKGWRGRDAGWERVGRFFGKVLALTFAVGVATGIVMEFQFGTNWARYSRFVGDIFGAPLAAEAIFAFFLESGFLGLYLFGRGKVSKGVHWFSILMVAVGSTLSAFWILVANSWQQTPAGFVLRNGRAELTDFWAAVFNPSTLVRFTHTMAAALLSGAFLWTAIAAWFLLRGRHSPEAGKALKAGLVFGAVFSVLLLFPTGHEHARQVAATQPAKFATMEGLARTQANAPLLLFAIPSEDPEKIAARVELPGGLNLLLGSDGPVKGLDAFPKEERPPQVLTFAAFHTMVGLGSLFILLSFLGLFLMWKKRLERCPLYLRLLVWAAPLPLLTCQFGWVTAEVGRQPWIVYGLLKTGAASSVTVTAGEILFSLVLFSLIYLLLGALYLFLLFRKIRGGMAADEPGGAPGAPAD